VAVHVTASRSIAHIQVSAAIAASLVPYADQSLVAQLATSLNQAIFFLSLTLSGAFVPLRIAHFPSSMGP
jgi:hypothetical protein